MFRKYINLRHNGKVETIDEVCEKTWKAFRKELRNVMSCYRQIYGCEEVYASSRSTKEWRESN